MVKQRHQLFVMLLSAADGVTALGACYLAWAVRHWKLAQPIPADASVIVREPLAYAVVPMVLYALWAFRLYRPRRDRTLLSEALDICRAVIAAMAAVVAVVWLTGNTLIPVEPGGPIAAVGSVRLDPPRLQLTLLAPMLFILLAAERVAFRAILRHVRSRGWNLRHACIVGVGRLGQITCRTIERNTWTGINVAYFVGHHDKTSRTECVGRPVLGGLDDLEDALERRRVDSVYLALPGSRAAQVPDLLKRLERYPVDVRLVPDVNPRYTPHNMLVSELDGMPILSVRENPMQGLGGMSKRALDLAGALGGLVVLSPLMVVVAALVKLSGPGPVIFKQRRVSLGGETFDIYKFRTMHHAEDEQRANAWTERDDPRITAVGTWLRRTSLDELPQLFNVLLGDMSLVGPRPERPELIERFREDWRGYMLRQHVKAGMTGWAQVNGLRGDTSLRKRLQYDLFYVRHWSLLFDLRILIMTLGKGFVHRNAH
ncbi:MAG: undecaprenyl-phosphate glucose phosphotransferase [Planctomycetota bacterium]